MTLMEDEACNISFINTVSIPLGYYALVSLSSLCPFRSRLEATIQLVSPGIHQQIILPVKAKKFVCIQPGELVAQLKLFKCRTPNCLHTGDSCL